MQSVEEGNPSEVTHAAFIIETYKEPLARIKTGRKIVAGRDGGQNFQLIFLRFM